jgi:hypothetical protein
MLRVAVHGRSAMCRNRGQSSWVAAPASRPACSGVNDDELVIVITYSRNVAPVRLAGLISAGAAGRE